MDGMFADVRPLEYSPHEMQSIPLASTTAALTNRRHHQTRSFNAGASFPSTAVTATVTACPKLDSPFLSPLVFANAPP
jgi:hypothetical protein